MQSHLRFVGYFFLPVNKPLKRCLFQANNVVISSPLQIVYVTTWLLRWTVLKNTCNSTVLDTIVALCSLRKLLIKKELLACCITTFLPFLRRRMGGSSAVHTMTQEYLEYSSQILCALIPSPRTIHFDSFCLRYFSPPCEKRLIIYTYYFYKPFCGCWSPISK